MSEKNPVRYLSHGVFYGLLVFAGPLQALDISPLPTRDQNPLIMIHGLPAATPAQLPAQDHEHFIAALNISNAIIRQQTGGESLFVDAESYQLDLSYRRGLSGKWMFGIHLPLIAHSGGFLDAWIDNYHEALNLPEGIRPDYPRDQLYIQYIEDGNGLLEIQQRSNGAGDLSLQLAWQHILRDDVALSYWGSLKLPTGDSDALTGSGNTELALWLASHVRTSDITAFYGNLGMLLMRDGDVLEQQQKNAAGFGVAGVQFHAWPSVLLKAQIDAHSALYDSELKFLGRVIQLTFGGSILIGTHHSLDIAVAEDVDNEASPDVNFNFTWHSRF